MNITEALSQEKPLAMFINCVGNVKFDTSTLTKKQIEILLYWSEWRDWVDTVLLSESPEFIHSLCELQSVIDEDDEIGFILKFKDEIIERYSVTFKINDTIIHIGDLVYDDLYSYPIRVEEIDLEHSFVSGHYQNESYGFLVTRPIDCLDIISKKEKKAKENGNI
ncbi:MAG: hypothetical protein WC679_00945 [Bacteroidales bacterium]|jgi:hypothetical protein